jgi:hypothetical protein
MNPQLIADLEAARSLIDTPEKWCRGVLRLYANDGKACAWCMMGAVCHISQGAHFYERYPSTVRFLKDAIGCDSVSIWNDAPERTHADILAAFDRAIESERSKA